MMFTIWFVAMLSLPFNWMHFKLRGSLCPPNYCTQFQNTVKHCGAPTRFPLVHLLASGFTISFVRLLLCFQKAVRSLSQAGLLAIYLSMLPLHLSSSKLIILVLGSRDVEVSHWNPCDLSTGSSGYLTCSV